MGTDMDSPLHQAKRDVLEPGHALIVIDGSFIGTELLTEMFNWQTGPA
jgi:hypothetical protein